MTVTGCRTSIDGLGLCAGDVTVIMPGGHVEIGVSEDFALKMLGPVGKVADGMVADELVSNAGCGVQT